MSSTKIDPWKELKELKRNYNSLLETHQNDLIAIKQRQQALKKQLQEAQEESERLLKRVEELERGKSAKLYVKMTARKDDSERLEELEMSVRKLMDQNIELTANNTSMVVELERQQHRNGDLEADIERMKRYIASLEKDLKDKPVVAQKAESCTMTELDIRKMQQSLEELSSKIKELEKQVELLNQRDRRTVGLLRKKQTEVVSLQSEIDRLKAAGRTKRRKTETEGSCNKCREAEQQVALLKEMVRSQKVMVRAKEIEVQKFKLHCIESNGSIKSIKAQNKSLPPIKKK